MKKPLIIFIVSVVAVGVVSFYGGMQYAQTQAKKQFRGAKADFANLSQGDGQNRMQIMDGVPVGGARSGGRTGGGVASGEILSKDDKSITVKLGNGGSKIIFVSGSTKVTKTTEASAAELSVGEQVVVTGSANADGSINAQTVQIRPKLSNLPQ